MATTIQVSDGTRQVLERLKKQQHATTYDQVIQQLIRVKTKVPATMFASARGIKWNKKDRIDFHEL